MNMSDTDLALLVIAVGMCWVLGIGIWWERNRAGGTRDMRRQRNRARAERDEARLLAAELSEAITSTGRGAERTRASAQPATTRHLRAIR